MAREQGFNFKKLDVYQAAVQHLGWCLEVSTRIHWDRKVLTAQMLRAALSTVLNIAEASGRHRVGESAQHLRYAKGSLYESAAMLDALLLMGVIDETARTSQEDLLARTAAMLAAMIRQKNQPSPTP
jgi:four helix bundle protein